MPGSKRAQARACIPGQWPPLLRVFDLSKVALNTHRAAPGRTGGAAERDGRVAARRARRSRVTTQSDPPCSAATISCSHAGCACGESAIAARAARHCLRPCGTHLRRNLSRRSRGRALAPRRQRGIRSTRRRQDQRHRILKTSRDQSQGDPGGARLAGLAQTSGRFSTRAAHYRDRLSQPAAGGRHRIRRRPLGNDPAAHSVVRRIPAPPEDRGA